MRCVIIEKPGKLYLGERELQPLVKSVHATLPGKSSKVSFCSPAKMFSLINSNQYASKSIFLDKRFPFSIINTLSALLAIFMSCVTITRV